MVGVKKFLISATILVFGSTSGFGCFVAAAARAEAAPQTVTIGYLPGEVANDLKSKGEELAVLIEKRTGIKVRTYVGSSYGDLVDKMGEKKIDFAFLSALSYVEVEQKTPVRVLLKKVWDQGYYYSVLMTKKSSSLRKPIDLKGKRIAFVDEKSGSGYLYPQLLFRNLGLDSKKDFKSVIFSGGHDKSVELLRKGEVDAIAIFANDNKGVDSAWSHHKGRANEVRVLWSSAAIPNDPFCVRSDFYERFPKTTHDLMFGLIEMNEDAVTGPELKRLLGVQSLMVATSQQYEPVREMYRALKKSEKIEEVR